MPNSKSKNYKQDNKWHILLFSRQGRQKSEKKSSPKWNRATPQFRKFCHWKNSLASKNRNKHENKMRKTIYMSGTLPERRVLAEIEKFTFSIIQISSDNFVQ
jgi:hypothetical protein